MSDNGKKFHPFDKREDRIYSKEEELERFRQYSAFNKTIVKGRKKGLICINNGKETKLQDGDLPIPEGWVQGYIKRSAKNEQQGK